MSESTRDRLVTVYPYIGENAGGYVTPAYGAARGQYWCRISLVPGDEFTIGAQAEHSQSAFFEFADEVPVEENDLIVDDTNLQWKVGTVTERRALRARIVRAFRTDETADLAVGVAEEDDFIDGGHADSNYDGEPVP